MKNNVIIVGGGLGGLSSGIRLLNKGYKVTIIEKNDKLGGKINLIEENDFKFDLSASIIMTPKSYTDIFEEVGKNYKNYFKMHKIDPIYKVFYYDKTGYNFYSDTHKMINELEKIQKGLSVDFYKFLSESYKKYYLIKNDFLDKPMINLSEVLNFKSIKSLMQINPLYSTSSYIDEMIKNEKLRDYLIFLSMYIGVNPYTNSNIHTLIPSITHLEGLYYIEGGMYKYIESLEKLFNDLGGKVIKNCIVNKVLIKNNKICGVRSNKNTFKSDIVICNSDFSYSVENLIDNKYLSKKFNKNNIKNKDYSCSVFILYLGLDKIYDNLNVHNIYINKDFEENLQKVFKGGFPTCPSMYIYYPSIIDKSFCKNNHSSMNIMLRVPNLSFGNISYNKENIYKIRNMLINTIKNIKDLEDIEEHIIYENYLTPYDLQNTYNCYYGNAFGLSHKLTQNIYLRPHLKSNKVKGLYFIGASTHPGNGASVVLDGSKVLCEIIEKS